MISISSKPFFMDSAFGGGQGGVDLIFRFLGNLYDFTPNLLHFIIVVLGESLEGDRRFIGIGQRGLNGFGHGIVGQGDFSAALVGGNHQTAAVYGACTGQGTIDFLAALLHFMLYRNGFIIIFCKGKGFQVPYMVAGPVHAGVLHAPPGALPGTAAEKMDVGEKAAARQEYDGNHNGCQVFLHDSTSFR